MEIPGRVRWMQDIYGEYQRYYTFLKKVSRHTFRRHGFTRISTPILEKKDLIVRSAGADSDVVSKEMYDVIDKKGRELVLKPEGTAPIMRAYLDELQSESQPVYLYYIEPHFRYDRPQRGRFRQFHQVGGEIIGESDPIIDAECIFLGADILNGIGLKGKYKLKINTLGTPKEREKYKQELQAFFESKQHLLDETDKARIATNPMRILDSKNEDVREMLPYAPQLKDYLKKDSVAFYEKVKEYLELYGVEYEEDPTLVRGLDYYAHTVWEFVDNSSRTQDAFGGGGRYDGLAKAIGHKKDVPGCGFAMGVERMIDGMIDNGYRIKSKDDIDLYFIQVGDEAKKIALPLSQKATERGLNVLASFGTPSMKAQLKKADKIKAKYVAIIGIMEARNNVCQLKDMANGTQTQVKTEDLIEHVVQKVGEDKLDVYDPTKELLKIELPE